MSAVALTIRPIGSGRFAAMLDGAELCRSRAPFFAAARALLTRGADAAAVLLARHDGSSVIALRSTIGEAAKWSISEGVKGGLNRVPFNSYWSVD